MLQNLGKTLLTTTGGFATSFWLALERHLDQGIGILVGIATLIYLIQQIKKINQDIKLNRQKLRKNADSNT